MLPIGTFGGMMDLLGLMPAPKTRPQEPDARQLLLRAVMRAHARRKGVATPLAAPARSARLFFLGAHAANDNRRSKSDAGTCA